MQNITLKVKYEYTQFNHMEMQKIEISCQDLKSKIKYYPYLCCPFTNNGGGALLKVIENQHVLPCTFKKK